MSFDSVLMALLKYGHKAIFYCQDNVQLMIVRMFNFSDCFIWDVFYIFCWLEKDYILSLYDVYLDFYVWEKLLVGGFGKCPIENSQLLFTEKTKM